jgi:photosystem II stability/assembly factor-like uncharacterized protein
MRDPSRLLLALLLLRTLPALAHAGLPETSNVTVRRGHPEDLFVGATFGAVVSRDGGQSWRWLCSEALGHGGSRPDAFLWREDGELLAANGAALLRSRDGGCSWSAHPFFLNRGPTALASHRQEPSRLWVATGLPGVTNALYRSEDGGESFTPTSLSTAGTAFSALRVAPSDPRRLYLSSNGTTPLSLWRSDDAGATWRELPHSLPELTRPYDLLLLHVAAHDPDHLWARVSAQGETHLLESLDGGRTLKRILSPGDFLVGVESSADARTWWAATPVHLYRSRDGAPATPLPLPEGNACAYREVDTLYACGSPWVHGWALARSHDEGDTWEPLFSFKDIRGVLTCPEGTPGHDVCGPRWPQMREVLGVAPPPPVPHTNPEPPAPAPAKGCAASDGLLPFAWVLSLAGLRRSRRRGPHPEWKRR